MCILDDVKKLQVSSERINNTISEMDSNAHKINETWTSLTQISEQIKGAINEIGDQINQFTI